MDFDFDEDPFDTEPNGLLISASPEPEQQPNSFIQTTSKQIITDIDDILFGWGSSVNLTELSNTLRQKYSNVRGIEYDIHPNCLLKSITISTSGSSVFIRLTHDVYVR